MRKGFTLLELILVTAMTSAIAVVGYVMVRGVVFQDARDTAARLTVQALRRAQRSALTLRSDGPWGVSISSASATVFRGDDYAGRDPDYDEVIAFPVHVSVSGTTEFAFGKGTGRLADTGTVSFLYEDTVRNVIINELGTVTYGP